jgi:hypothetical protein
MRRTQERSGAAAAASTGGDGTRASAAAHANNPAAQPPLTPLVVPLLQLWHAVDVAGNRMRMTRAVELYERTLAAAEATLPRDSLIIARLLNDVVYARTMREDVLVATDVQEAWAAAWRREQAVVVPQSQRCLTLLHARWRAGTLLAPTPDELAFSGGIAEQQPLQMVGARQFIVFAENAMQCWPQPLRRSADDARLRCVHGALQVALELQARGELERCAPAMGGSFPSLLAEVLMDTARGGLLCRMRAAFGLTRADEAALHRLAGRYCAAPQAIVVREKAYDTQMATLGAHVLERGAADLARHGLRICLLPGCGATEPHPKAFKVCARCRAAVYCSPAHQAEDWRRHKCADCSAAATP